MGKDGVIYASHEGLCLETMDLLGSNEYGGRSILRAGDVYRQVMRYAFSVLDLSKGDARSCHD